MTIFTDSATITSKTSITRTEVANFVDVDTPTSTSSVFSDDRGPFNDGIVVSIVTEIINGEYSYTHPTGSWGSFDTDDGII